MLARSSSFRGARRLVAASSLMLGTLVAASARAQSADEIADIGEAAAEAPATADPVVHAILVEAVAEYDAGHYAEAQALFRRANDLSPSARTLRGLGMASFELRQYVTASRALTAALEATTRPLTDDQRAHVEELLARARGFVARLAPQIEPRDASLRIDGVEPLRESDGSVLLDPGRHVLVIEDEGRTAETIDLSLEPGTVRELVITLRPLPSAPVATVAPSGDLAWAGAGLGITAAIGLVGATALGIVAATDDARLRAECTVYVCPESARGTRDRARELSIAADVVGTAAAVIGAAGVTLLLVGTLGRDAPPIDAAAACSPDGCLAVVGGSF